MLLLVVHPAIPSLPSSLMTRTTSHFVISSVGIIFAGPACSIPWNTLYWVKSMAPSLAELKPGQIESRIQFDPNRILSSWPTALLPQASGDKALYDVMAIRTHTPTSEFNEYSHAVLLIQKFNHFRIRKWTLICQKLWHVHRKGENSDAYYALVCDIPR